MIPASGFTHTVQVEEAVCGVLFRGLEAIPNNI